MDAKTTAIFSKMGNNINSIASAAKMSKLISVLGSPQVIGGTLLVLVVSSIVIYISIEFFSRNRFRGISWGIFTNLISLNSHITDFNKQLYSDFNNIHKYVEMCNNLGNDKYMCFKSGVLRDIHGLMSRIKKRAQRNSNKTAKDLFVSYVSKFFSPNPSFPGNKTEDKVLRSIFKNLYADKFHDNFGDWLQHKSVWNFVYDDKSIDVNDRLLPKFADDKMDKAIDGLKRGTRGSMASLTRHMKQAILLEIKTLVFNDLLNTYSPDQRAQVEKNLDNLFFNESKSLDHSKISQKFEEECSLLTVQRKEDLLQRMKENGIGKMGLGHEQDTLTRLNRNLSFADALQRLHDRSYKVSNAHLFRGIPNLHPHIKAALKRCLREPSNGRAASIINACYQVFNEMIYFKVKDDGKDRFMFLKPLEIDNIESNSLAKKCMALFNAHIYSSNKKLIDRAIRFTKSTADDATHANAVSTMSTSHVSIARLKYLIQDYFVIINEYNDKSNPDQEDIRDFWEKRVNSFGIPIPGTKSINRPKDAPDRDYTVGKNKRSRSNDPFSEDLDRMLIKNTWFGLYKEYLNSVFVQMRHPRIPFFQSLMATIRYFIPDPNVVIDNFLAQLKGKVPKKKDNPTKYDFSFKYDPNVSIV